MKLEEAVHHRLYLLLLAAYRLNIALLHLRLLRHAVAYRLAVCADGGKRAFQVVRHAGDKLLAALLAALLVVKRSLELRCHEVNGVARGLEFVVPVIGDRLVEVPALYALHSGHKLVKRGRNMAEQ